MGKLVRTIAILCVIGIAIPAQADVVVKQKSSFSMAGLMDMDMTGTEYVKADRSTNETSTTVTGGMMAMFGGQGQAMQTIEITRLDKGVAWDVKVEDSLYTERPLASIKQDMMDEESAGTQDEEEAEKNVLGDPDQYDWTVKVTTTDKPVDINGFKCKGITTTADGVSKTDPKDKAQMIFEYWYSKDVDGYDELMNYRNAYAKATGVDMMEANENTAMFFDKYGDQFKEMQDKMKNAEGYPIKTTVIVKGTQPAEEAGDENDKQGGEPDMQAMMKAMMGAKEQEKSADGMVTIMSITNTIESITKEPVDNSKFEVPAGFQPE
jgi:hypothetical protein